jgi:tetratricopeptide (TPR) repeat protein
MALFPVTVVALALVLQSGNPDDPYAALRRRDYDVAIASFRQMIAAQPSEPGKVEQLRLDLAFTLLKAGETEAARDQFELVLKDNPAHERAALEFAFLCFETRKPVEARRTFQRLANESKDPNTRETAAAAFRNIDQPLVTGIARWRAAVIETPQSFSAHQELAQLAENRDELALAAQHYEYAWKLRRDMRSFLLDLGRVWKALGRMEDATAALLAASRGAEPRTADKARALLPARYPYVYEFQNALKLDGTNLPLRREYAYLLLEMGRKQEAEAEFRLITEKTPADRISKAQLGFLWLSEKELAGGKDARPLLDTVLEQEDDELADRVRTTLQIPQTLKRREETPEAKVNNEARQLAKKSLDAGFLKDAARYLEVAHETDPIDFGVMLQLGWTHNILKDDRTAIRWFNLARRSPDPKQAAEADRAYRNLAPKLARFHTSTWIFPFFSSRWQNGFGYGQVKTELNLLSSKLPLHPYVSTRFIGDIRRQTNPKGNLPPQYLSESSFIFGLGLRTTVWKGVMAWGEAGQAVRYLGRGRNTGLFTPDYRGGISAARSLGRNLGALRAGWFAETTNDFVFVSRFDRDFLLYSQSKGGYTFGRQESTTTQLQAFWNWNVTTDIKRFAWANYWETGPGVRFRFHGLPPSMFFILQGMRGQQFLDKRSYNDLRAGFWYAFAH